MKAEKLIEILSQHPEANVASTFSVSIVEIKEVRYEKRFVNDFIRIYKEYLQIDGQTIFAKYCKVGQTFNTEEFTKYTVEYVFII